MNNKLNKIVQVRKEDIDQYDYINEDNEDKIIKLYAKPIGQFLIHFNNLDHEINCIIAAYFHDDLVHQGYMVIKELIFRNKVGLFYDIFSSFIKSVSGNRTKLKRLNKLHKELIEINTFRNYIVHANWLTLDKNQYVRTKLVIDKEDGWIKGKMIKITTRIINTKIRNIDVLINQLSEFEDEIWN